MFCVLGGAAYLLWVGWSLLFVRRGTVEPRSASKVVPRKRFAEGIGLALIDPASTGFMLAFLPQFVDPAAGPVATQLIVFGVIQKLSGLIVLGTYAFISGAAGNWLRKTHAQRSGTRVLLVQ